MGKSCGLRPRPLCLVVMALAWASSPAYAIDNATFWEQRNTMMEQEESDILGHSLKLTEAEMKANAQLMTSKAEEIGGAFENNLNFLPAKNFMTVINDIEASSVFQCGATPAQFLHGIRELGGRGANLLVESLHVLHGRRETEDERDELIEAHFIFRSGGCARASGARFVTHISVATPESTISSTSIADIDCLGSVDVHQAPVNVG
ncbi:putative adenosine deaminase CECR1-like [Penaeus vannamei]|uniref:Putative adenosine deaminase CECR1-like n=1 Tax=Penaeus vannamei TaxID=6689 RepID=A0A3R7MMM0_PENVA|nr:putative adenosine deaminase CECR1-like [Penaeus vannamei]